MKYKHGKIFNEVYGDIKNTLSNIAAENWYNIYALTHIHPIICYLLLFIIKFRQIYSEKIKTNIILR